MNAFRAVYTNIKNIPSRNCVQIIFEVPTEQSDAALQVLGGIADTSKSKWFGIAPLREPQPSASPAAGAPLDRRDWRSIPPSQQAAICVGQPAFETFLKEQHPDEWHETGDADACLKMILRIESKREIAADHKVRMAWHQLNEQYDAWKLVA